MSTVTLDVASCTNVGQHRALNEDSILARDPVFIVADGMGGHDAGEKASYIAVQELSKIGASPSIEDVRDALTRARWNIDCISATNPRRAAGTTVTGLVLVEQAGQPYWLVVNVGDSRTYSVVDGELKQVSVDHSEVQEMIDAGRLDEQSAHDYARRHVITRVLGAHTVESPDYWLIPVEPSQRWMVCSDGLTGELSDHQIAQILTEQPSPRTAVNTLVDEALAAGGRDNVSVIIVDVVGLEGFNSCLDEKTIEEVTTAALTAGSVEGVTQ